MKKVYANTGKNANSNGNNINNRTKLNIFLNNMRLLIESLFLIIIEILSFVINLIKTKKNKDIKNQIALVTGGGNGLGKEICIQLAKHGCNIAIADIDFQGAVDTAHFIATSFNVKAKAYNTNIAVYEEVVILKDNIKKDLGTVDILVNNAGLMPTKSTIHDSTPKEIEQTIHVNLTSHFWTVKVFMPEMKKQKRGHIVATASVAGLVGIPLSLSYGATKFGVRGLMESLKIDLLASGQDYIKTTTVFPYFIRTNKDLVQYLDTNDVLKLYPALQPVFVADEIVNGLLQNKSNIIIPGWFRFVVAATSIIPDSIVKKVCENVYKKNKQCN